MGGFVLFSNTFILRQGQHLEDEHNATIIVPMFGPVAPNHYISNRCSHAETYLPLSFKQPLMLSKRPPESTHLLDLQSLP